MPPRKQHFHPTELGLLNAIHADPRDDAPRLVYADWLEESGKQDYAEFIRLQIEAARAHKDLWTDPKQSLREGELLRAHRDDWAGPNLKAQRYDGFSRGLPRFQIPHPRQDHRSRIAQAYRFGSPRHCLMLFFGAGDEAGVAHVAGHPIMDRAHWIVITCAWEFSRQATRSRDIFIPLLKALSASPRLVKLEYIAITSAADSPGVGELAREILGDSVTVATDSDLSAGNS
jgi:uncharacterized protein (TIGR02996 family)